MRVSHHMEKLLVEHFSPTMLSIIDESAKHAGHAGAREGGESHFAIALASSAFAGKSQVERHRMVYEVLKPLFERGLHALAIDALTPGED